MAWHKSQVAFIATSLFAALLLVAMLLVPLGEYCQPERPERPAVGSLSPDKGQAPPEQESPFVQLVRTLLQGVSGRDQAPAAEKSSGNWWRRFLCEMKVTDSLIAVFTLWLAIVGAWLGYQVKRTVDSAEKSNRMLERAYVAAGPGARRWAAGNGNQPEDRRVEIGIAITAGNYGKTPAYLEKVYWGVCEKSAWPVIEALWPHVEEIANQSTWSEVLPPSARRSELSTKSDTFSELDHANTYVSFGKLVYSDIFQRRHWCAWKYDVVSVSGIRWQTIAHEGAYLSDQN